MVLTDHNEEFLLVPATGTTIGDHDVFASSDFGSRNDRAIQKLLETDSFYGLTPFNMLFANKKQSNAFIKEYYDVFKAGNDMNEIYLRKGQMTIPVNSTTKEVMVKGGKV